MSDLDDPSRGSELASIVKSKGGLRQLYQEIYTRYSECIARAPIQGMDLELGAGGGFAKETLPELITSDILPYTSVDLVLDATRMPFPDDSLRTILMLNVLHHIPNAAAFFQEAVRCLKIGGRVLIVDQHPGWISTPLLKHMHHEPFQPQAKEWAFASSGPLSGANGALAWIVFQRDRAQFEQQFPQLKIRAYRPHTPLRYWLSGGLKSWSLLPSWSFKTATKLDQFLLKLSPNFGSFVDIELEKVAERSPS